MEKFDWSDLAFADKSAIKKLKATFIIAPRQISQNRFKQLLKENLNEANILLGISKEPYVLGLEGQLHFTMLRLKEVKETIEKVNSQKLKNKIFILEYSQRDLPYILEKVDFKKLLFIRGSWYHALHYRPEYHILLKKQADYKLLSPFTNEAEARGYVENIKTIVLKTSASMSPIEMMRLVNQVASQSYDYAGYQIGAVLGKKTGGKYKYISSSHNIIVPFETYAMHYGAAREENFAQSQDLNHYDTVHAEMSLLLKVMSQKINLTNTSLFISVLPCPTCARMLGQTNITEFVYANDHSDGYALKMLEMSGKSVKRLVV